MDVSGTRFSSACARTSQRGKFGEKRRNRYGIERAQVVTEEPQVRRRTFLAGSAAQEMELAALVMYARPMSVSAGSSCAARSAALSSAKASTRKGTQTS
jgi:hypothetical protein